MFTFAAMPVKFVGLLILFAWCTGWCAYELTRPQDARGRVSNALHLLMSVVMLAMVWSGTWMPLVAVVPLPVLVGTFALATGWFVAQAVLARRGGVHVGHHAGHAVMFAAMTWHLAAMSVKRGAAASGGAMGSMHGTGAGGAASGGMDPAAWTAQASRPGGVLWVFALVGVPLMAYLLIAGLADLRRALHGRAAASAVCPGVPGAGTPSYRAAALADASMNLGMFWMSTGLLVAVAPFMTMLSF